MPGVEILSGASECDARPAVTEQARSETVADEHDIDHLGERMASAPLDAEQLGKEFAAHDDGSTTGPPTRSVRRATARRASNRRAAARSRQHDTEASIVDLLTQHPGSTAGDLAKSLNLNPESVANRLTQLVKTGAIEKAAHGYNAK